MEEKFQQFYSEYSSKIEEYYSKLKVKKDTYIMHSIIMSIVLCSLFLLGTYQLSNIIGGEFLILKIVICLIIIALSMFSVFARLKPMLLEINEIIILDILKYISKDENSKFWHDKMISTKSIEDMELFNLDNLKYNGRNYISSTYNNNAMNFADMEIYYYKDKIEESVVYEEGKKYSKKITKKIKKTLFDGCYIGATLNKTIADHIYLIPNNLSDLIVNGKINDYITYKGNEIELENLEFSKKYKVYSDNEIQARYILTLSLMEKINDIDNLFEGKKYIVFKEGRRFAICIEDFKIENLRQTVLPLKRNSTKIEENMKYIFERIYKLFDIYNILDLGNDLYSK